MGGLSEYEIHLSRFVLDKTWSTNWEPCLCPGECWKDWAAESSWLLCVCSCLLLSREVLILLYTTEQTQQPQCRFYDIQLEAGSQGRNAPGQKNYLFVLSYGGVSTVAVKGCCILNLKICWIVYRSDYSYVMGMVLKNLPDLVVASWSCLGWAVTPRARHWCAASSEDLWQAQKQNFFKLMKSFLKVSEATPSESVINSFFYYVGRINEFSHIWELSQ